MKFGDYLFWAGFIAALFVTFHFQVAALEQRVKYLEANAQRAMEGK